MTKTQLATVAAADHVINAPKAHIAAEPPECLAEILDQLTKDLAGIREIGIDWRIVQLEIMKGKFDQKRLAEVQKNLIV